MSEVIGEAVVEVRGDTNRLSSDVGSAGKTAGSRFSSGFRTAIVGLGAAVATVAVGGFLKDAVSGASDLQETMSKTGVVFGSAGDAVIDFASQGASALGQTKQEALDAATTFGVFGKAAGLSGQDLAKFSTDFTGLATDLASFHNSSPEEAVEAIGAALRGEAEPIRKFGVLLDEATLREEALRLGLIKTTSQALTPQQKTLAAQAAIMRQTADAQGDFQRTSGGLANQQRILKATFVDIRTEIGSALLPVVTAAVVLLNKFITGFQEGTGAGGAFRDALMVVVDAVRGFIDDFRSGVGAAGSLRDVLVGVGRAVAGFVSDFVAGEGAAGALRSALSAVIGAALGLLGALAGHRTVLTGLAGAILAGVVAWKAYTTAVALTAAVTKAYAASTAAVVAVQKAVQAAALGTRIGLAALAVQTVATAVAQRVAAAAARAWAVAQLALNAVMTASPIGIAVVAIAALVAALILAWKHSETFRDVVTKAFSAVRNIVGSVLDWFADAISTVVGFVRNHWQTLVAIIGGPLAAIVILVVKNWTRIREFIGNVLDAIRSTIVNAWQAIRSAVANALDAIRTVVSNVWQAIRAVVSNVLSAIRSTVSNAFSAIRSSVSNAMTAARAVVTSVWNGIKSTIQAGASAIVEAVRSIPGRLRALGGAFLSAGQAIITQFLNGLQGGAGFVSDIAGNVWDALRGMLNSAISSINAALEFSVDTHIPGVGSVSINPPDIPLLARGTRSFGGGLAVVGERGPELVAMPQGAAVFPAGLTAAMMRPTAEIHVHMPTGDPEAAAQAVASRWVLAGAM